MKDFNVEFHGPRNMWKEKGNSITLYSGACEVFFEKKKFLFVSIHLWFLGFQIFEFLLERKKKKSN